MKCELYVHVCGLCSEQKLSRCDSLLYADNETDRKQPLLSPRPIVDAVLQLEALLGKLEQAVANVIKHIDDKKLVTNNTVVMFVHLTVAVSICFILLHYSY